MEVAQGTQTNGDDLVVDAIMKVGVGVCYIGEGRCPANRPKVLKAINKLNEKRVAKERWFFDELCVIWLSTRYASQTVYLLPIRLNWSRKP